MKHTAYGSILREAVKGSVPGITITFLMVVIAKWVYFISLNSMGESVTPEDLGQVLVVRMFSDLLIMTSGFILLFSVTKRLISPMRLGFMRFTMDTTVAGFGAIFASLVLSILFSMLMTLFSTGGDEEMMANLAKGETPPWLVVVVGVVIIGFFMYCWISMLAQCVVNRYLPRKERKGLWRLSYLRRKSLVKPLLLSVAVIILPPLVGKYIEHFQHGGAGMATLFQGLSTVCFAMAAASGITAVVRQEEYRVTGHVQ